MYIKIGFVGSVENFRIWLEAGRIWRDYYSKSNII
jgi:hypothetical protein